MLDSVCSIVRCVPFMRRIFSNPITALVAGACLRFFVLYYPAGSGDTVLYEQIATNWLKRHAYAMDIGGVLTPVDTRVPGYPAFLAVMYWLSGKTGADARLWVMSAQVFIDLLTCLVIAAIAAVLVFLAFERLRPRRAFTAALWLAALCPFTANYAAVILTETWATFFTALSLLFLCLLLLRFRGSIFSVDGLTLDLRVKAEWFAAFAGFAAGLGTLFRPETPLVLVTACLVLGWYLLRGRQVAEICSNRRLHGRSMPSPACSVGGAQRYHAAQITISLAQKFESAWRVDALRLHGLGENLALSHSLLLPGDLETQR